VEILGNILGVLGMLLFLYAYFMLQRGHWQAQSYRYFSTNLAGAMLLMASLVIDWNLPAFLLEAAWALISMWGILTLKRAPRS
jgi:hypothetical protein